MRTIALIDFSLGGHHLSFVRTFSKILLEQGNRIICLVPEVEKVESWVYEFAADRKQYFKGYTYNYGPKEVQGYGRFNETVKTLRRWRYDADLLKKVEKENRVSIDLVFFAWIDSHLAQYLHPRILDLVFPYKWTGLYFHPYHLRLESRFLERKASWRDLDSVFLSRNCVGVAVHDLGIIKGFSNRVQKPVIHFPETADGTAPDYSFPIYQEIRHKAKDRLVVGMIGCEKHKGTLTLIRMAKKADPSSFYFAFLGILPNVAYTAEEWTEVQDFIRAEPENVFFHFQPIPEGRAYNAVFCAMDVPFLVYDNFISSSNRLTKAAIFEKLVLASDNYCVGEDVKRFHLGAAVPPQRPEAALDGLESIAALLRSNKLPQEEWKAYRQLNSTEQLYQRFLEITTFTNKAKS